MDGGDGNDVIDLESAIGPTVLVGGTGDDVPKGGSGRTSDRGGADSLDGARTTMWPCGADLPG